MERKLSIDKNKKSGVPGFLFSNIFAILLLVFFSFSSNKSVGQAKAIELYPTAGITWRSTATSFFNFKGIMPSDPTIPYDYERNVQGLSMNPGIQIRSGFIGIEYYSNLRYDVVSGVIGVENERIKDFLIDHNFNLIFARKIDFGLGLSIVNSGKGFEFVNPIPRYHNIEFKSYNAFVTIPVKKIFNLEIKALYIPKDFPENPEQKCIMFSLRIYYKFDFLNKALKKS